MNRTPELRWFKSSYSSNSEGTDCVEVAHTPHAPHTIHVRDSKNATGPRLAFGPAAWAGFVAYSCVE
ncbi:DUF397 domain-containing protein [Streptomyces hydrogenans]|uniref:DUF397 domain-containing protein n=1 Tax=Streptomyces hydrogenans TaxID=1873719 RepID=UPI0033CA4E7F